MGAALSYYTVFSLAPLLLIVISVAGLVFGEDAVRGELFAQLQRADGRGGGQGGPGPARQRQQADARASSAPSIGIVVLLVGATTVFGELQDALDRIWRAPAREKASGLWRAAARAPALVRHDPRHRLPADGLAGARRRDRGARQVVGSGASAAGRCWRRSSTSLVGFGLTTAVFAMIYKLMPRVKVAWHDVWLGALVTALLFTIGKFLIGLYIGKSGVASGFGAAGSLVVVLRLGLLLGADLPARRRVHLGLREDARLAAQQRGHRRSGRSAAARTGEVPARSAEPKAPASADAAASRAGMRAAAPATAERDLRRSRDVGAGVAFLVALRFLVPRLLRRL